MHGRSEKTPAALVDGWRRDIRELRRVSQARQRMPWWSPERRRLLMQEQELVRRIGEWARQR